GFPRVTSSAVTTASMYCSRCSTRSMVSTFRRGADEAIACFQPAAWRASSHSRAPGSGVSPRSSASRRYSVSFESPMCRIRSEPPGQNAIVALAEARQEHVVREVDLLGAHRALPREPVILLGIDERPVEIPQDAGRARRRAEDTTGHGVFVSFPCP